MTVARDAAGAICVASPFDPGLKGSDEPFDPARLEVSSKFGWIREYMLSYPHRVICALRWLTPVVNVPLLRWSLVLRYDEVREVLDNDHQFPVAWGGRMVEVTEGRNFVLGMPRSEDYRCSYAQLAKAFPRTDVANHIEYQAATIAEAVCSRKLHHERRQFDAIQDLITAVPTLLCESYFGVRIADPILFAKWTLAISSYLFGPHSTASDKALALAAAACLRQAIRDSIASAKNDRTQGIVLPRLLDMQRKDPEVITDDVIHAQLFGMVMGFIPTNVLAGGNILETLLRRPDFMKHARAAALAGDDDLLWRCLREALRFRHINPGPWRLCPAGYTIGAGGRRPIKIPRNSKVFAIIQSAMFDPRRVERPHVFDPDRRDADYMVFGVGQHWCLGAYIATAQLTQTFKPLLKMNELRAVRNPAVRTQRFSIFPLHLQVEFRS